MTVITRIYRVFILMQSDWWLLLDDVNWALHNRGMNSGFLPCIVRTATLQRFEKMVSAEVSKITFVLIVGANLSMSTARQVDIQMK
jgi:uncharacterized membrane protein